jgi:hypothetical protein
VRISQWPFWVPLLLTALLFPLLPGHSLAPLHGLPLDAVSLALLGFTAVLFFGWPPCKQKPSDRYLVGAFVLICLAKLGTHAASLEYGLRADYYTRAPDGSISTQRERSIDFPGADSTRLDQSLRLGPDNIPVYFWNDMRFNFYQWEPSHPNRFGLPLYVKWTGFLYAPEAGRYGLRLEAYGPATVAVGDSRLTLGGAGQQTTTLSLGQGAHPVSAEYVRLPNTRAGVEIAWDHGSGFQPLAAPFLLPTETTSSRWAVAQWAQYMAYALTILFGATLAVLAARLLMEWWERGRFGARVVRLWRRQTEESSQVTVGLPTASIERPMLAVALLGGLIWALAEARPLGHGPQLFNGGEDWLTYESYARDIALNGLLQLEGALPGSGRPYWLQPAYAYFLAGLHRLAGESQHGPIVIQLMLLPVEGVVIYYLSRRLFGRPAAVSAALLFTIVVIADFKRFALLFLTENLFQLLLPLTVLALLATMDHVSVGRVVGAGVLTGLLVVTRFTALLYVPVAWLCVSYGVYRAAGGGTAIRLLAGLAVTAALVVGLVPLRNMLAAGAPVVLPTSGAGNLLIDHQLPSGVDLIQIDRGPLAGLYSSFGLTTSSPVAQTIEYVRQAPGAYASSALQFVAYALGAAPLAANAAHPADAIHPEFAVLVVLYVVAWIAWRETGRLECWLVHAFLLTHLLILAVFGVHAYPPRTVLPLYVLMPVVSGFGVIVASRWIASALGSMRSAPPTWIGR